MTAQDEQQRQDPDELELHVEEISDLETAGAAAEDVRGGGSATTQGQFNDQVGKQNC